MKEFIGRQILFIGAYFWNRGGFWNKSDRYEDLTWTGKLGYKMFRTGMRMLKLTVDDVVQMVS
jgi:hypothetical protein